jgi:hypothetical protein
MTASLDLLTGAKKSAVDAELAKGAAGEPENEASTEEDVVDVDVDALDGPQLDALVKSNAIEVPKAWAKWGEDKKREWLKAQFGDDEEAGETQGAVKATSTDGAITDTPEVVEAYENADIVAASNLSPTALADAAKETAALNEDQKGSAEASKSGKKKSSAKKKDLALAPKEGEVLDPDVIQDAVHIIENLKKEPALKLIQDLIEQGDVTEFKLGGVLSLVQANGWYAPYASFREFVEKEHGLHYRKATYLIEIYNRLGQSGVPWSKVKSIGWTKLKEIAKVLTVENVDEWVQIASNSNTLTLIDTVKAHLSKDAPKGEQEQASKTVTTKTFKVHEDQKATIEAALAKARDQGKTSVDTVALELICMDYLGGVTIDQKLKAMGLEAAANALAKAFPDANIDVGLPELGDDAEAA